MRNALTLLEKKTYLDNFEVDLKLCHNIFSSYLVKEKILYQVIYFREAPFGIYGSMKGILNYKANANLGVNKSQDESSG